ncbi:hypothetical protein OH738_24965 [Streptomyces hirsutus]|uniref:Secreted protein n=1 Tax=Streptomyces hirsutus TaxID=35620 RepID=A0ABZ1GNV6_9ACTN|nr:hypothetical protein [Streptomyces hirsutus]WSD06895.1 hypothetical protein OIE73_14690 [Streptomyces hirsutus]WTD19693.1 hypothetical protein OH738_24965 [Streptomyces hirsutus]WTD75402.1 hypothetical protein OHB56_16700 [Streptomyces sp. NBC_01635]
MAMPRPTVAQFAYGACTVVLSAFALLLLSRTSSGVGIALVVVAALALGLLVAMTAPQPKPRPAPVLRSLPQEPVRATLPSPATVPAREAVRERAVS